MSCFKAKKKKQKHLIVAQGPLWAGLNQLCLLSLKVNLRITSYPYSEQEFSKGSEEDAWGSLDGNNIL